jgi:beta-1,4-mannosyltransferase
MAGRTTTNLERMGVGAATKTPSPHIAEADGAVVVLESFGPPRSRSNPYRLQLMDSLPASVRPLYFSWKRALVGRFDVFHVQWPEVVLQGRSRVRTVVRCVLFALVLLRIRAQRKALVRTLHDLAPYEPLPTMQRWVIRLSDRWTTLWVTLTDVTRAPRQAPTVLAPIGHYRAWFADTPRAAPVSGRMLHFGLIRKYKGIDTLVSAFSQLSDDHVTLRIIGYPQDGDTATTIQRACHEDHRISAITEYVADEELATEVTESELVVLPFDRVTNSSSLILALSLDRPVLVPSTPITEQVAAEVGAGWVLTYNGSLDSQTITNALDVARAVRNGPPPDLSRREWSTIGAQHAVAFARAVRIARRRPRWGRCEANSRTETI